MLSRMLQRRGTAAQWEDVKNTVILAPGEIGLETDTGKFKVGNGVTVWKDLSYYLRDSDNDDIYSKLNATQTFTGSQVITPANASTVPLVVAGTTGQSAYLQSWRDVAGNALAYINPAGMITAAGGNFTANVEMNGGRITGLGTPSIGTDAANKQYVDDSIAGLIWKSPVNLVAASGLNTFINVPLTGNTGTVVLDGHAALTSSNTGYRLLLIGQTTSSQNGIYVYTDNGTTYTLIRATDSDTYQELNSASVFVNEGASYGTSSWVQTNHYLTSFSGQTWVQFNGAAQIVADGGLTKTGNTLAVGAGAGIQVNANDVAIASGGVTSDMIANGTIVDNDISASAEIAATKISGTAVTQADTGTVTSAMILDGTITNSDINASANIAPTKINGTAVTQADNGTVTSTMIANGTIVDADISSSAAISQSKVANLVSDLAGKASTSHTHTLDDLSDVVISGTPQSRQVIKFNGTNWVNELPSGGISVGDTAPSTPAAGDAWMDTNDGSLYVYYVDATPNPTGNTGQWIQVKANSALEGSILTRMSAVEARATVIEQANAVRVTSQADRDAKYPAPVQGNTVFRSDLGYEEKYYAAYNATTNPDGTTGTPGWYRYAGGAPLSQNYLLNGDMEINQRGLTTTPAQRSGTDGITNYGLDRWSLYNDYVGRHSQQSASITGSSIRYAARIGSNSTAYAYGGLMSFGQKLESVNSTQLRGKTITVSFYIKFNSATFTATVGDYGNFRYEIGYNTSTTDAKFFNGSTWTGADSYTFATLTNGSLPTSWTRVMLTGTVPSNANNIYFGTRFLSTAGYGYTSTQDALYYEITGLQLEEGPVATPFRRNQAIQQAELAACQRYYWRISSGSNAYTWFGSGGSSSTAVYLSFPFPVTMRTIPVLDASAGSTFAGVPSGTGTVISLQADGSSNTIAAVLLQGTGFGAGTTIRGNNTSSAYIGFSAEL